MKTPAKKPFEKATLDLKNWLKTNRTILITFVIYLLITLVAIHFHENWEDEAQAWLTVRDCSLPELVGRMKYEGHFLPWYLLIMPFAKLGLPFATINYISWLVAAVSVWLMLKHLPLKLYQRIIFIFTLPMLYFFPVVARCYCLLPLAVILLIMFHKDRYEKPFRYCLSIALAALVHTHCLMFALVVGIDFVWGWFKQRKDFDKVKNRRLLFATLIPIVLVGASCFLFVDGIGNGSDLTIEITDYNVLHVLMKSISRNLSSYAVFLPDMVGFFAFAIVASLLLLFRSQAFARVVISVLWQYLVENLIFDTPLPQRMLLPFFFLLFFLCTLPAKTQQPLTLRGRLVASALLIAAVCFDGSLVYYIITTVFVALAFTPSLVRVLKLRVDIKKFRRLVVPTFTLFALVSVGDSVYAIQNEIKNTYTDSKATAEFIKTELISDDSPILFMTSVQTNLIYTSIVAHLGNSAPTFYDMLFEKTYTYSELTNFRKTEQNETEEASKDDFEFCHQNNYAHCYYIYPIISDLESLQALNQDTPDEPKVYQWLRNDQVKLIYDSTEYDDGWSLAAFEHFRIYEVMI